MQARKVLAQNPAACDIVKQDSLVHRPSRVQSHRYPRGQGPCPLLDTVLPLRDKTWMAYKQ